MQLCKQIVLLLLAFIQATQRHDSRRKSLQKKAGTVCHEAFDETHQESMHAKISLEAAVQETTGDFDLKILTDHVDCSVTNANIAQGQTDLRCLQ